MSGEFKPTMRFIGDRTPMTTFNFVCPETCRKCERADCLPGRICWTREINAAADAIEEFGDDALEAGIA